MKKLVFGLFLVAFSFIGKAQVIVEGVNVNELDIKYIELVGTAKVLNPFKMKVFVDYGQDFSWKQQTIKDAAGKNAAFNSMIDALNFMDANGWVFVSNYVVSGSDGSLTYRYILQKKDK